ncbi:hypothetical protein [Mucilaginibacter sp.]|uniref:hypothetical protein n=1 Tax=Mucilaginibacter sp. TaxID=1882438 RepID=UPI002ED1D83B
MENQNNENLFESAITMQELEPRLELAAVSSKTTATVEGGYTTGSSPDFRGTVTVSF